MRYDFPTPFSSISMRRMLLVALGFLVGGIVPALTGCADAGDPGADSREMLRPGEVEGSPPPDEPDRLRIVFLGTSLTEGLGLDAPADQAWPARVGGRFDAIGETVEVVNAGIGGETSAGAVRRLEWILRQDPDVLVVETGANDGLRGLPADRLEANLDSIVEAAVAALPGMEIAVVEMEAPPNMGPEYADAFRSVFRRVADRYDVGLVPFLLEGVAGDPGLNQADGIHPTAEGHEIMAGTAWPVLDSLATEAARAREP